MKPAHPPEGLAADFSELRKRFLTRRSTLNALAALPLLPLIGCSGGNEPVTPAPVTSGGTSGGTTVASGNAACPTIPTEVAGPFPADGSGVPNALTLSGIQRSNITKSIGSASGLATGIPLTVKLELKGNQNNCAALANYVVYLWHCDALGRYSMYSTGVASENYLRGIQVADTNGNLTFETIVPGCYDGRWPHMHFEVFTSLSSATRGASAVKTTQLALPKAICEQVYATSGYTGSTANLAKLSLASDGIFQDGSTLQLANVTGSVATNLVANLVVGLAA